MGSEMCIRDRGDIIEISFGDKQVKVEVLSIEETYNKEAAKELYKML